MGLPLCYDINDYPIFVTMSQLEPPTLHDIWPCVLFSISFWPEAYS